ncbi:hypothetical protein JCM9140_3931 [Halalkalibacter wakoensis JCM 9140]|uniref:Uncharacterized protein n=1 Tax=Halalkalibacter wakoensis JCM 9140 TaxID=1236970 RepID=W4Q6Y9_9BACI|nr:hypothetical protein [Halalkalibacter wakoensis]GAE27772.1 hypothetical protein JCM9140_3931 [Halalkalibacter wakoensis JCM 9140]
MGFLGSFVSGISSAVSKVVGGISSVISKPLPPIIGGGGGGLGKLIKKVVDFFLGTKYDSDTASTDETKNINRDLSQYAKTFHSEANRVEEELLEKANDYFDKVILQLEEMQEDDAFLKELPIKKVKKEIRELRKELRGQMKNRVSRAYSLDNHELLGILKVDSDNERVSEMEKYAKRVMKIAVDEFLERIDELSEDQLNLVEDLILSKIDQISIVMQSEQDLLEELRNALQKNEDEVDQLKAKISSTIDLCDTSIQELKTV